MRKTEIRYAIENGFPMEEQADYVQLGNANFPMDDPRGHPLFGETGNWFAITICNYLGDISGYQVSIYHADQPLRSGVTLITEVAYNTLLATNDQTAADYFTQVAADEADKVIRLKALFISGQLFPGDAQTFQDTYGFDPTVP